MTFGGDSVSYEYDPMGRLRKETWSNGVVKYYTYYGNLSSIETMEISINQETHIKMSYEYDEYMRIWKVYEDFVNVATYSYDENSNLDTVKYANGVIVDYDFNLANLVTSVINKKGTNIISQYNYTYYLDGSQSCERENMANKLTELYMTI